MRQGQVIQMLARWWGMVFGALGLLALVGALLDVVAPATPRVATHLLLAVLGFALARSWEGARAYLLVAALANVALLVAGLVAPDRSLADWVLLPLAWLVFMGWVANLNDRDRVSVG